MAAGASRDDLRTSRRDRDFIQTFRARRSGSIVCIFDSLDHVRKGGRKTGVLGEAFCYMGSQRNASTPRLSK